MVFVFCRQADVPVLWTALCLFEKHLVVQNHPLTLFFIQKRFGALPQTAEILVEVGGFDVNQCHSPHRAFGVMFLGEERGGKQQHENSDSIELLHDDLLRTKLVCTARSIIRRKQLSSWEIW